MHYYNLLLLSVLSYIVCAQANLTTDLGSFLNTKTLVTVQQSQETDIPANNAASWTSSIFLDDSLGSTVDFLEELYVQNQTFLLDLRLPDGKAIDILMTLQDKVDLFWLKAIVLMPTQTDWTTLKLRLDSQLYFYDASNPKFTTLHEVYAIKGGPPMQRHIGNWKANEALDVFEPRFWQRRSNLQETEIINGLRPFSLISQLKLDEDGNVLNYTGIFADTMDRMAKKLNFTHTKVRSRDGRWGNLESDGKTWNGLVRMLMDGEIDVSSGGHTQTLIRDTVVDFSVPLFQEDMTLMGFRTKGTTNQFWVYLDIFPIESWAAGVAFLTFIALGYYTLFRDRLDDHYPLFDSFAWIFYLIIQMGADPPMAQQSKIYSTRILLMTANFFAYLVFMYYTCDLTARMTSRPPPSPIR